MAKRKKAREQSPPQRRPGGRNAEVREAVRRATLELLVGEGFGAISLPAVARRAGVNKTTVYRRWSGAAALLHDALIELEALALPDIDTGTFAGDLSAFLASRLRLVREPRAAAILRAVIGAEAPHPALYDWIESFWKPRQKEWRSPIERAIERGELAPSAREVPLVELVAGPLLLATLATRRRVGDEDVRVIADVVAAGVLARYAPSEAGTRRTNGKRGTSVVRSDRPARPRPRSRSSRETRPTRASR